MKQGLMVNNGVWSMKEDELGKWIKSRYEVSVFGQRLEYKKRGQRGYLSDSRLEGLKFVLVIRFIYNWPHAVIYIVCVTVSIVTSYICVCSSVSCST